jgi:pilus assembly protein Flp/PilA
LVTVFYKKSGATQMQIFLKIFKNEDGATAIEYGLLVSLISIIALVAMTKVGFNIMGTFGDVNCYMSKSTREESAACQLEMDRRMQAASADAAADRERGRG